nr:MAG TPA: hypothetical protein [Caudoviricetes sp.]
MVYTTAYPSNRISGSIIELKKILLSKGKHKWLV